MSLLNQKINLGETMGKEYSDKVVTVSPESSVFETLRLMQEKLIKRIVVIVKNKPVGIVTERDINRFLANDKTARAIDEIPIKHVMKKNIITITDGIEDHFEQCAARMVTFKIGSVILVNDDGELIGIISRTDLTKAYANVFGGKYTVKEYMNPKVITCRKSDSLKLALVLMNKHEVSKLVVIDSSGNPIGLITTNTFLTHSDYFTKGQTRSRDYLLPGKSKNVTVGDLLEDKLITISDEDDLATAASIMIKKLISGIPVVDNQKNLIGIISKTDVVRAFSVVGPHKELKTKYQELY